MPNDILFEVTDTPTDGVPMTAAFAPPNFSSDAFSPDGFTEPEPCARESAPQIVFVAGLLAWLLVALATWIRIN